MIVDKNQSQEKKLTNNVHVRFYIHLLYLECCIQHPILYVLRCTFYICTFFFLHVTFYVFKSLHYQTCCKYIYIYIYIYIHMRITSCTFHFTSFLSIVSLLFFLFDWVLFLFSNTICRFFLSLLLISFNSLRVCFFAFFSLYLKFFFEPLSLIRFHRFTP